MQLVEGLELSIQCGEDSILIVIAIFEDLGFSIGAYEYSSTVLSEDISSARADAITDVY